MVRVAGLGMQTIVTYRYGLSSAMDAYTTVWLVVTTLAQLFAGGLEAGVIPVYARTRVKGKEEASRLFSTLLNLLIIILLLFTAVLFKFRNQLIIIGGPGLQKSDPDAVPIGIALAPYLLPVLIFMTLNSFMECLLNAEGQFGWPAYAGILVPIGTAMGALIGGRSGTDASRVIWLCIGQVGGLVLQLIVIVIRAHQAKFIYRPILDLKNPAVKAVVLATGVPLFSALMAQLAPLLDQVFTSNVGHVGSVSALSYANKLNSVFTGVIFSSVARAALPYLSSQAAIKDMKSFKETLRLYIWGLAIGLMVLSAAVIVLAEPVIQFLWEHGSFNHQATLNTTWLLMGLAVGMTPTAIAFFTSRAFSALGKTRVLLYMTIINVILNAIFDYYFGILWGPIGITLATSAYYFCSMIILLITLSHMIGPLNLLTPPRELLGVIWKLGMGDYYIQWVTWREENLSVQNFPYAIRKNMVRASIMLVVLWAGAIGTIYNAMYTVRIAFGSIVILLLMRYPYILLMTWIALDALIGSTVPLLSIFQGGNLLSGLAAPTLFLLFLVPVKPAFKRMPTLGFLLAYLMWVFLSIGFSEIGIQQFLTLWLVYVANVSIGVLVINLVKTEKLMNGIIDGILLQLTFVSGYGIYDWFVTKNTGFYDTNITWLYRTGSVYNAPPTLAFMLSVALALALYRCLTVKSWQGRILAILATLTMLIAFILTFARGPFVSFAVSLVVFIFFLPSRGARAILLAGIAAVSAVGAIIAAVFNVPILSRFLNNDITTLNGRTYLWQALLDHFDPTHLLGEGLNASDQLLIRLQVGVGRGVIGTAPHNIFIGTLYDHGIIGVTLVTLMLIAIPWNLIKAMLKTTPEHRLILAVALAAYINIIMQAFEVTVVWNQAVGAYVWMILSLPFAYYWDTVKNQSSKENQEVSELETIPRIEAISQPKQEQLSHV
ncbi:MAG: O-antigen ligase family protein [Chloroflexi bacterium]|nr:O-antigen ligase family protein [Chloroflexota bacterium]